MPFHMVGSCLLQVLVLRNSSIKNLWASENVHQSESGFWGLGLTPQAKRISHHVEWHKILCQKTVSEIVYIFVCSHLCLWKNVTGVINN